MYQNLLFENMKVIEDVEIEGEVMLMEAAEYVPRILGATAKLMKRAGNFVCQFEVSSDAELFVVEASAHDPHSCFRIVEKKMKDKISRWNARLERGLMGRPYATI